MSKMKKKEPVTPLFRGLFSKDCYKYLFPAAMWVIILLWCVLFILFTFWGVMTSLKTPAEFYYNKIGFPRSAKGWGFNNYVIVLKNINYQYPNGKRFAYAPELLWNSFLFAFMTAFLSIATLMLTSYVYARFSHIWFTKIAWWIFLWVNYMPFTVSLGAELKLLNSLGLYDNIIGMWVYNCGGFGGGFLLYYATWKGISPEYSDAAKIDGAGQFRILFSVILPLTKGLFFVQVLTKFTALWGNYTYNMTYLPSYPTFALAIWKVRETTEKGLTDITAKLTAFLVFSVPLGLITYFSKNLIMDSMSVMGGIKG